ncbi:MAG: ribosome small subunit-dependent GTPase A [Streptococcaceae bacterium]|jgi:ribosome biogenesis GTPase|nr:ribosome small subunit-dependent GTPase A [Streptococcaceae bacterium]
MQGQIVKLLGGFYTVVCAGDAFETRARGNFRHTGEKPLVGDFVTFDAGYILEILPRKNKLVRPPLANIDQMVLVMSTVTPNFSRNLLDRFLAYLENKKIPALIVLTKLDINARGMANVKRDYAGIGYPVLTTADEVAAYLPDKLTAFMGQTGAGKSTLLNKIAPELQLATGETSEKLGRGRHTTRHVELFEVAGGLVVDTPGFSSLDYEITTASALNAAFIDIAALSGKCKFRGCTHTHEPACAVKEAVFSGELLRSRYDSYCQLLSEIQNTREIYEKNAKKQP